MCFPSWVTLVPWQLNKIVSQVIFLPDVGLLGFFVLFVGLGFFDAG